MQGNPYLSVINKRKTHTMLKYLEMPASLVWHSRSYEEYLNDPRLGELNRMLDDALDLMAQTLDSTLPCDDAYYFDKAYLLAVAVCNQQKPERHIKLKPLFKFVNGFDHAEVSDYESDISWPIVQCMAKLILATQRDKKDFVKTFIADWLDRGMKGAQGGGTQQFEIASKLVDKFAAVSADFEPQPVDYTEVSEIQDYEWLDSSVTPAMMPDLLRQFHTQEYQEAFLEAWREREEHEEQKIAGQKPAQVLNW